MYIKGCFGVLSWESTPPKTKMEPPKKWRWMEDDSPFQRADFQVNQP